MYRIVAGTHNLTAGGTEYEVRQVIRHYSYHHQEVSNNIALIKVATPIEFTELVKPIELNEREVGGNQTLLASKCSRHFFSG